MEEKNEPVMLALLPVVLDLFDGAAGGPAGAGTASGGGASSGSAAGGNGGESEGGKSSAILYGKQDPQGPEPGGGQEQNPQYQTSSDSLEDRQRRWRELTGGEFKELYDQDLQRMTSRSAREAAALREQAGRVQPVLDMLMDRYKIADGDMGKLLAAVENDGDYLSRAAEEAGMSVEQFRQFQQLKRQNQELLQAQRQRIGQERAQAQMQDWSRQAQQLKTMYPSFDLSQEAQNRDFVSMLRAGVPVRQAFEVIHMDEIKAAAASVQAKATEKAITANIKAKGARPQENGTGTTSGFTVKDDVSRLTPKDRAEIARRAARGEIITF